ncbi:MAG: YecA family protein [Anaerolineae bacterium]
MPDIGRNDPCPCGSGRKYKACCLIHDRISEQRDLNLTQPAARLLTRLFEFARLPRFNQDLLEGFNLYWGGAYDPAGANQVGPENMRRFFEWFVHDHPTHPDKQVIIDIYAKTQAKPLGDDEQVLLQAWRKSTLGLYRIVDTAEDDLVPAYDTLRQTSVSLQDGVFARNAKVGDLMIGRLYQLNDANYLSHTTMVLPVPFEPELTAFITNAYQTYGSEQGQASWDGFLRAQGHLFSAFLLSSHGRELHRLIGSGTPYIDPAIARDRLVAYTTHSREAQQKAAAAKQEAPMGQRTASGIIVPGAPTPAPAASPVPPPEKQPKRPTILIPGRDS